MFMETLQNKTAMNNENYMYVCVHVVLGHIDKIGYI